MSSPDSSPALNGSVSSSPRTVRAHSDHSPVRRRSSTISEAGEYATPTRPRLSPTLIRGFNPLDADVRERQRAMDADMAIQLSRARSSITSPNALPAPISSGPLSPVRPIPEENGSQYPNLSPQEEHDAHAARGIEPRGVLSPDVEGSGAPPPHFLPSPTPEHDPHFNHLSAAHDPSLLVALESAPAEDPTLGGLPMYQATSDRQAPQFDFSQMEEYARDEKARLGITTPVTPDRQGFDFRVRAVPSRQSISSPPPPDTLSTTPEPSAFPSTSTSPAPSDAPFAFPLPRARHRKLSHSTPHPRRGKLALFEQPGAPPPALAARAPHLIGTALSTVPSYDNLADVGATSTGGGDDPPGTASGLTRAMSIAIGSGLGNTGLSAGHDRPYRFSFYSNALSATIHARSLSELPAEGQTFENLFFGSNDATADGNKGTNKGSNGGAGGVNGPGTASPPKPGAWGPNGMDRRDAGQFSGMSIGNGSEVCTWWLDVLAPSDEEMKLLSKVFNIHPLTTEDIQMEETREKIELFRNYYFVCFRGFDQDPYSPTHLEPLNMYIIVFREGILSFHYRATPHPQNVRRRIKQLKDYISVTSDWISYALIDDITDAFGPLIQSIEYEVDSIDELVLILKEAEQSDMLRRIGTCRKKVMGLLRLMGNKADVVKGLAKRCNENWRVAPTSDIGLYLSDIQDHLITMTQNLNHYEKILSRSHSNYLAQISIEMTDANNQINDVLSKLTALGTVLIPMNLITGLWGMNVHVPGQDVDNLHWFGSIIAVLAAFAVIAGWSTYKLMVRR